MNIPLQVENSSKDEALFKMAESHEIPKNESVRNWSTASSLIDPSIDAVYNKYIVIGVSSFFAFILFLVVGFLIVRWMKIPYNYDMTQNVATSPESDDDDLLDNSQDETWLLFHSSQLQVGNQQGHTSTIHNMPEYDCRSVDDVLVESEEFENIQERLPRNVTSQNSRSFLSNFFWKQ